MMRRALDGEDGLGQSVLIEALYSSSDTEDPTLEETKQQTQICADRTWTRAGPAPTVCAGPPEAGSASHMADSARPESRVLLIPHGSLGWDEKGWDSHFQLHISNREMSMGCGKLEWQNITLSRISNEDTGYDESECIV